jgi:hypothetical protein
MPKNPHQDKKTLPKKGSRTASRRPDYSVGARPQALSRIMKDQGWMQGLKQVRDQQQAWLEWLKEALPEELRGSLVNVVQKREELTVLAVSAAWSARLRYALEALEGAIKERAPAIVKVKIKVAPAGRSG